MKRFWTAVFIFFILGVLCFCCSKQHLLGIPVFRGNDHRKTLIIDAGHGGFDGGAQAADGTSEQDINLRIAKDLCALCGLFGESATMTRWDENALDYDAGRTIHENKEADIKARKKIADEVSEGVFLSIHLNKFDQPQYYGAQTFYSLNDSKSVIYAENIQENLLLGIQNDNIRKAKPAPKTVYLMQHLDCPAVIVECGFLSNPNEADLLKTSDYQKKLALCIFCGYMGVQ